MSSLHCVVHIGKLLWLFVGLSIASMPERLPKNTSADPAGPLMGEDFSSPRRGPDKEDPVPHPSAGQECSVQASRPAPGADTPGFTGGVRTLGPVWTPGQSTLVQWMGGVLWPPCPDPSMGEGVA